jgi:hypothetical protein
MAVVSDEAWDDDWVEYTYECKAKKVAGAEAFLILFRLYGDLQPRDKNLRDIPPNMAAAGQNTQYWWNLGGWGNTRSCVERWIEGARIEQGNSVHSFKTGEWYQIKIENGPDGYKLILNDELIAEVDDGEVKGGRIGLGGWATAVEYDDVLVYGPDGPKAVSAQDKLPLSWGQMKVAK